MSETASRGKGNWSSSSSAANAHPDVGVSGLLIVGEGDVVVEKIALASGATLTVRAPPNTAIIVRCTSVVHGEMKVAAPENPIKSTSTEEEKEVYIFNGTALINERYYDYDDVDSGAPHTMFQHCFSVDFSHSAVPDRSKTVV